MTVEVYLSIFITLHFTDRPQHPNQLRYSNNLFELFRLQSAHYSTITHLWTFSGLTAICLKKFENGNLRHFQPNLLSYTVLNFVGLHGLGVAHCFKSCYL